MTMNSLEGHMKEFGLYPNRWWRAIGGFWAAAQLGYSSGSVQSCLGEKKKRMEKKASLKAVVIVQWEMIRKPTKWVEKKQKSTEQTRIYWEAQVASLMADGENRQCWSNYKRGQI